MELCAEKEQYGRCVTVKLKTFEWDVKQKSNTLKREVEGSWCWLEGSQGPRFEAGGSYTRQRVS